MYKTSWKAKNCKTHTFSLSSICEITISTQTASYATDVLIDIYFSLSWIFVNLQTKTKPVFKLTIIQSSKECHITLLSLVLWICVLAFDLQNYNIRVNAMWQVMQNFKTRYGNWTKQTKSRGSLTGHVCIAFPPLKGFLASDVHLKKTNNMHLQSWAVHITKWRTEQIWSTCR